MYSRTIWSIITTVKITLHLEERLSEVFQIVQIWMGTHMLELMVEITEAVVLTWHRRNNSMSVHIGNTVIQSELYIKYLEILLDSKIMFKAHANHLAKKVTIATWYLNNLISSSKDPS